MDAERIAFILIVAALLGLLIRWVSALNTARPGFTLLAKYPTPAAAEEARAFLGQHGVRAEVDDRRGVVKNVWHGSVLVLVPTGQLKQAKRAFAVRARSHKRENSGTGSLPGGAA